MGVPYLQRAVDNVLRSHIQRTLPELMGRLQNQRAAVLAELESLKVEEKTEMLLGGCVSRLFKNVIIFTCMYDTNTGV